jgi:hypothetical protein
MGTIETILKDFKTIANTMAELEDDDDEGWKSLLNLIKKSQSDCRDYMETPSIIRNLQDKTQPKR